MQPKIITFISENGRTELQCRLNSLPLKEEKIIEKSRELFNDPEPCIIHRSFAIKKVLMEIGEYLEEVLPEGKGQIMCENIPNSIIDLLCISKDVLMIKLDL
ncbi:MAG TPA: hypothetical protein VIO64_21700 [Pseudobacteroides sp.]|uniref:hypothetical protein n=1 Tax=Pseudobacteroides sp. TaxID=1968840 RepID=UPI002F932940